MEIRTIKDKKSNEPCVIALGNFDGVHLGHQRLFQSGSKIAGQLNAKMAVLLLDPHPFKILHPGRSLNLLTDQSERLQLFEKYGIERLFLYPFTLDFANTSPREFIENILLRIGAVHIVVGFNYSFGAKGKGTPQDLKLFGQENGFGVSIVEAERLGDKIISSSEIRSSLLNGDVATAKAMMGHVPKLSGTVKHGDKRGRQLGYPTANIQVDEDLLIPKNGVYAVNSEIDGKIYGGMMNIGLRPTFYSEQEQTVEVNFFDFAKDIYGRKLVIEIQDRLRSEKKFSGVDEIINQLDKDRQDAMKVLDSLG